MTRTVPPASPREFFESYLPGWFAAAAPSQVTSPGALVFHVGPESYALRLAGGKLLVSTNPAAAAILQVSMAVADFAELVRQAGALFESGVSDRLLALRSLSLDAERAKMIRNVDGSVAFEIADGSQLRTLLLSPGVASNFTGMPVSFRLPARGCSTSTTIWRAFTCGCSTSTTIWRAFTCGCVKTWSNGKIGPFGTSALSKITTNSATV